MQTPRQTDLSGKSVRNRESLESSSLSDMLSRNLSEEVQTVFDNNQAALDFLMEAENG